MSLDKGFYASVYFDVFNIWYYLAILFKGIILSISLVNSYYTLFYLPTQDEIMGPQKIKGEIKVNIFFPQNIDIRVSNLIHVN